LPPPIRVDDSTNVAASGKPVAPVIDDVANGDVKRVPAVAANVYDVHVYGDPAAVAAVSAKIEKPAAAPAPSIVAIPSALDWAFQCDVKKLPTAEEMRSHKIQLQDSSTMAYELVTKLLDDFKKTAISKIKFEYNSISKALCPRNNSQQVYDKMKQLLVLKGFNVKDLKISDCEHNMCDRDINCRVVGDGRSNGSDGGHSCWDGDGDKSHCDSNGSPRHCRCKNNHCCHAVSASRNSGTCNICPFRDAFELSC
jgi:hypothetical protein